MGRVLEVLDDVRKQIAAKDAVLKEARKRRDLVAASAMTLSGTLRRYSSGSVAHATVNDPVDDADGGIVLDRRSYPKLGPEGDGEGPDDVIEELRAIVGAKVREEYPDAKVGTSKRGLVVTFASPLDGQDPSVDMIVTLTRKEGDGLWIPNLDSNEKRSWDPSHPEGHTKLFGSGTRTLRTLRARVVRLAKAWNKQWSKPAMSSFNVEALALEFVAETGPLDKTLAGFFAYAKNEIEKGDTKDPAGVSAPIRLLEPRSIAVKRLGAAAEDLQRALDNEDDEDEVLDALASVFRNYVDAPGGSKSSFAAALRKGNQGVSVTGTGLAVGGGGSPLKSTRSYGGEGDETGKNA